MQKIALHFNENLVLHNANCSNDIEVITTLAQAAVQNDCADTPFVQAVLKHEQQHPTALNTQVRIAVPHCHIGCKTSFLAVATLNPPVTFGDMADLENRLPVEIVFLIGTEKLALQSIVLKRFCDSFQIHDHLQEYKSATSTAELYEAVKKNLGTFIELY